MSRHALLVLLLLLASSGTAAPQSKDTGNSATKNAADKNKAAKAMLNAHWNLSWYFFCCFCSFSNAKSTRNARISRMINLLQFLGSDAKLGGIHHFDWRT